MPYPLAPLSQSCSPIPHLSGPIPAVLYLFSHPCNHLPAPLSLQSLSLLLHPCSSIPVFPYTTCMPFSPALLPQSSSPIPHFGSPIPAPLQLYAFSPIPATPLPLLCPCTPPPLFFHSCSPIPASYPYPSVPAPKLSLLPLSFSSVRASPSLLLHSCFHLCSPILAPHPCSLSMLRIVKSSQLPAKIAAYLVSIDWLLCLAFLYRLFFLSKISLDWPLALTTQLSTSKLSDNPACSHRCSGSSASPSLLLCPFISIPAP